MCIRDRTGLLREQFAGLTRPSQDDPTKSLFIEEDLTPHRENNRNRYFHVKPVQRLGNLTTNQSNVYAVWITVGYFEVSPHDSDPASNPLANAAIDDFLYPDGYELGQELGFDTGQVTRDRAFYIIDRSVPVAFERGRNHNLSLIHI